MQKSCLSPRDAPGSIASTVGLFPEAIAIFKFDTVLFPDKSYIYDDLADAYARDGQKDLAIASYEKSLAIEPDNPSAKAELEKLKNPPKEKP
jgi:tetratricopeptide (TPR) repeat protein